EVDRPNLEVDQLNLEVDRLNLELDRPNLELDRLNLEVDQLNLQLSSAKAQTPLFHPQLLTPGSHPPLFKLLDFLLDRNILRPSSQPRIFFGSPTTPYLSKGGHDKWQEKDGLLQSLKLPGKGLPDSSQLSRNQISAAT